MYKIATHKDFLLFPKFASQHPDVFASVLYGRMEHGKRGCGTIFEIAPTSEAKNGTRIHELFDGSGAPRQGITTKPKALSRPFALKNGLVALPAHPADTVKAYRSFAVRAVSRPQTSTQRGRLLPLLPRKKNWCRFQGFVKRHYIESLYHFTDSRNLGPIIAHGACTAGGSAAKEVSGSQRLWESQTRIGLIQKYPLQDYVRPGLNLRLPMIYIAQEKDRIGDVEILQIDPSTSRRLVVKPYLEVLALVILLSLLLCSTALAQPQQPTQPATATVALVAACLIGVVIGYAAHWLLRRIREPKPADLVAIAGLFVGGAVIKVLTGPNQVWWYMIGVFIGFFLYLIALWLGRETLQAIGAEQTSQPLPLFPFLRR